MHALFLPRLGQTMEEGLVAAWLVAEGTSYVAGEPVYDVETEKITTAVEASLPGRIVRILVPAESTVDVGTLLAVAADPGEEPTADEIDAFLRGHGAAPADASSAPASSGTDTFAVDPRTGGAGASTAVADTAAPAPSVVDREGRARAMPRTRALARDEGMDIETVPGTGPDGLVLPRDVHAALAAAQGAVNAETATPAAAAPAPAARPGSSAPMSLAHRRMAGTLAMGMVPQFTQMVDADVTSWREARAQLQSTSTVALTFTDLILEAVTRACVAVPEVNASYADDHLYLHRDVDITIAMDTPSGLLVPVLRRAQELSVAGRARARHELTERARGGTLTVEDMGVGTITVSNLGAYGIPTGVPLLVAPYAAIVFVGSLEERVVVRGGGIAVRTLCGLSISYDHRVVTGATAARFTTRVRDELEGLTTPPVARGGCNADERSPRGDRSHP